MRQTAVEKAFQTLMTIEKERSLLEGILEVLEWDESVMMPRGGGETRAEQKAYLAARLFETITDPKLTEALDVLESSAEMTDNVTAGNVKWLRRQQDRYLKIPKSLVEELARLSTISVDAWAEARRQSQFSLFVPFLKQMVELRKQTAKAIGYEHTPYDALLDIYEPGATTQQLKQIFAELQPKLTALLHRAEGSSRKPKSEILTRYYQRDLQKKLADMILDVLGFDRERGRLDVSTHPFCRGVSAGDVRLTTRYDEYYFSDGFFSTIHEAGHGMYEQGLLSQLPKLAVARACSMGIHESQSRLWENQVARSQAFWEFFFPSVQAIFPEALQGVTHHDFSFAVNHVEASFIRTESDEVTYNLHIILRFEIEQSLLNGELAVQDIPEAWNSRFRELFGLIPPNDAQGCLQDIHWSGGDFGYFPTYTLGNLYAAQFMEQMAVDLGDFASEFRRGQFQPLKQWLSKKIYSVGATQLPSELCENVTGRSLSWEPLVNHLTQKVNTFYS